MLTYGFFNSIDNDRLYDADQFGSIFNGIINDGVFMSIGSWLKVTPNSGMMINIGTGRAWFNGTWTNNDAIYPIQVRASELVLNRIDALVLEVNKTDPVRANSFKFVYGTPASNPQKPALTRSTHINQYPLAYIHVNAGVNSIDAKDIENAIGSSLTPFSSGVMTTIDADQLLTRWDAQFKNFIREEEVDFDYWFEYIKGKLSGDVAGNLQNQIDEIQTISNSDIDDIINGRIV